MLEHLLLKELKLGAAGALVNALTAPLMDMLRPSRKENVIGNMRPMGNASGRAGVMNEPVWNPADTPSHTIREQTENTKHMLMGGTDEANGYMIQNMNAVEQQRETTNCQTLNGYSAANGTSRARVVDADYNARLNTNKQVISRVDRYNIGNSSLASHAQNVTTFQIRQLNQLNYMVTISVNKLHPYLLMDALQVKILVTHQLTVLEILQVW